MLVAHLTQDRNRWQDLIHGLMYLLVPSNAGNVLRGREQVDV